MARRTKEDAEATRKNILKAALDIIYEKGYARSTFVDIAKQIELSKGAVYWHFKTKPDLFIALSQEMENRIETLLHTLFHNTDTLQDLKETLFEMTRLIATDEKLFKYYTIVYYRMEWTPELLPIKQFCDNQDTVMTQWIETILAQNQSADAIPQHMNVQNLAAALYGLTGGLTAYCLSAQDVDREILNNVVRTGFTTFFAGMTSQGELSR